MQLPKATEMNTLIEAFNNADNPTDRFAFAAAIRVEADKYVKRLDEDVLPMFQNAMVRELHQKNEGVKS